MTNKPCTCRYNPDELITVTEAAAEAGVSTKTIRRRIWSRELPHHLIGARTIRIRRGDLRAWLDKGHVPAVTDIGVA
jgi:excisionase family DNA binding protein